VSRPPEETQPERTALAWQRTGLGVLAVAGILAHGALLRGGVALVVLACLASLVSLAVLGGLAPVRYRQVRRRVGSGTVPTGPIGAVAGFVLVTAGAAAAAVILLLR
jgi:putative membrane protein